MLAGFHTLFLWVEPPEYTHYLEWRTRAINTFDTRILSRIVAMDISDRERIGEYEEEKKVIVIGNSSVANGIGPAVGENKEGLILRCGVLSGVDANLSYLYEAVNLLSKTDFHPDYYVFCVHPDLFCQRVRDVKARSLGEAVSDFIKKKEVEVFLFDLLRPYIVKKTVVQYLYYRVKCFLIDLFGQDWALLAAPHQNPWAAYPRFSFEVKYSEGFVEYQKKLLGSEGALDSERYLLDNYNSQILNKTVQFINEQNAESQIVFVLMPEMGWLRDNIPERGLKVFSETINLCFPKTAPRIIDFRDACPDESFNDLFHLHKEGKALFSMKFYQELNELIKE